MRSALLRFLFASVAPVVVLACSVADGPAAPAGDLLDTPSPGPADAGSDGAQEPREDAAVPGASRRSEGCGVRPAIVPGTIGPRAVMAGGAPRTVQVSIPAGYEADRASALVFVLHGAGDESPASMREWFADEAAAPGIYVYPQALPRTRKDGTGGKIPRWDLEGDSDLVLFDAALTELSRSYCIDRARVFASGFSSGGNLAQQLGCVRASVLRAFAAVAGPGPFASKCGGRMAAWMTHDVEDDALSIEGARASRDFWVGQNACGAAWRASVALPTACKENAGCAGAVPMVYCETEGVGHDMPAFAPLAIARFFASLD